MMMKKCSLLHSCSVFVDETSAEIRESNELHDHDQKLAWSSGQLDGVLGSGPGEQKKSATCSYICAMEQK